MRPTQRAGAAIALVSLIAAVLAARVSGPDGPWLWNLDLPKIDYPLASLFHDALAAGRLPLWSDRLGLGFPLYAEGQIGAFYPPNWLIFQLPPIVALDLTRVLHLTLAGVGTGLLTLRVSGSRGGALAAAVTAILGGAIVTKLEWHNLVAAYGWMPWVLLPLVRRPHPTRAGLVAAGIAWGVQALTGHPNTWLLTGLTAAVLMIAIAPRPVTLTRIAGFGLLGGAVGAVQLIPTAILTTLSVRSLALSPNDLFTSAATPFDILGFGFADPFARTGANGAWDLASAWYPDGSFALLEAGAFVGLPVLAFAAVGLATRRARPFVTAILVLLAIPIVAAFRPAIWSAIPVLDGLRSPVRAYVVVGVLLGVLAGLGIGRLGRPARPGNAGAAGRRALAAIGTLVGSWGAFLGLAVLAPATFGSLLLATSTFLARQDVEARREAAVAALSAPWPFLGEVALGMVAVALVFRAGSLAGPRRWMAAAAVVLVAAPLVAFGLAPNGTRPESDFSFAGTEFVQAVRAADAHRLLTVDEPGWYAGMPDQLATAGVPDIRMFSSLDLAASDRLLAVLQHEDPSGSTRSAVGIDVLVTFGSACPGPVVGTVDAPQATICRVTGALRPPYWVPAADVALADPSDAGSAIRPREATLALPAVLADARPAAAIGRDPTGLSATVEAPRAGYVWIDRAWWPAWRTTIDGHEVQTARALAGQLVPVEAGSHDLRQELVPWDAGLGLGVGVVALVAGLAWVRPRRRPADGRRTDAGSG